jgi:biotin transport system ATP-binding protein
MTPATSVIELSHITKSFPVIGSDGELVHFIALNDITLTVNEGECAVVGGANGSGKSLLMSIIAGLDAPSSGLVQTRGRIGLIFQDADSQILGETPREDIAFGVRNLRVSKQEGAARVEKVLSETGLAAKADAPARFLSGGEKRRLSVASILALGSSTVIFDEPYANLDYGGVVQVNALVSDLKQSGKTVIILTHELEKCLALSNRFIVLYNGRKVFDGNADVGLTQPLESWGIRNPLGTYRTTRDLLWR